MASSTGKAFPGFIFLPKIKPNDLDYTCTVFLAMIRAGATTLSSGLHLDNTNINSNRFGFTVTSNTAVSAYSLGIMSVTECTINFI